LHRVNCLQDLQAKKAKLQKFHQDDFEMKQEQLREKYARIIEEEISQLEAQDEDRRINAR